MRKYTRVYLDFFKYCESDFIPCEVCSKKAVDIHHIWNRKRRADLINDIYNLMALCRECHIEFGDKNQHINFLQKTHFNKIALQDEANNRR